MQTDRELLELALDALESKYIVNCGAWRVQQDKAIEALRARLAQPEQEPVAWADAPQRIYLQVCEDDVCEVSFSDHVEVSWCQDKINDSDIPYIRADTAPPQREWVGLTDEEIIDVTAPIDNRKGGWVLDLSRAIEAKLKEKNA